MKNFCVYGIAQKECERRTLQGKGQNKSWIMLERKFLYETVS